MTVRPVATPTGARGAGRAITHAPAPRALAALAARYESPSWRRAAVQVANTLVPMAALWAAAAWAWPRSVPLALACGVAIGLLQVRLCMFQHDCGHGSFLPARRANDVAGSLFQLWSLMPYWRWRHEHAVHHATNGNLDRRGLGDIDTLTVREYAALDATAKRNYRLYRHPFVLFVVGPIWQFVIRQRWPQPGLSARARRGTWWLDAMLLAWAWAMSRWTGIGAFVSVQLTASFVMGALSIFIFYVQHQHEDTYWAHDGEWSFVRGAFEGSSWLRLPPALHWISGNIGFHHVHHLSPRIPNYVLARAVASHPEFQQAPVLTLGEALRTTRHKLWDEGQGRLVGFAEADAILAREDGPVPVRRAV